MELTPKEYQQANAKVDAMIENTRRKTYANREKMPEPYLAYADVYNQLTGQEPTKRVFQDWLMTFGEWQNEGIRVEDIREAHSTAKFTIVRPGSLTATVVAIRAKARVSKSIRESELFRASDHPEPEYAPMPEELRDRLKKLIKDKSMEKK